MVRQRQTFRSIDRSVTQSSAKRCVHWEISVGCLGVFFLCLAECGVRTRTSRTRCPAACALAGIVLHHLRGAWPAADAWVALIVQGVVVQLVAQDVVPDLPLRPERHRRHLQYLLPVRGPMDLQERGLIAAFALTSAKTDNPGVDMRQLPLQRRDLAHRAAEIGVGLIQLGPIVIGLFMHRQLRLEAFDAGAVTVLECIDQLERLGKEKSRINGEHRRLRPDAMRDIDDDEARGAECGSDGGPLAVALEHPPQQRTRMQLLKSAIQFFDLHRIEAARSPAQAPATADVRGFRLGLRPIAVGIGSLERYS